MIPRMQSCIERIVKILPSDMKTLRAAFRKTAKIIISDHFVGTQVILKILNSGPTTKSEDFQFVNERDHYSNSGAALTGSAFYN